MSIIDARLHDHVSLRCPLHASGGPRAGAHRKDLQASDRRSRVARACLCAYCPTWAFSALLSVAGLIARPFAPVLDLPGLSPGRRHVAAHPAPKAGAAGRPHRQGLSRRKERVAGGWRCCPDASIRCSRLRPSRPPFACSIVTGLKWWSPQAKAAAARSCTTWARERSVVPGSQQY